MIVLSSPNIFKHPLTLQACAITVLGDGNSALFKHVLPKAQSALRQIFGMDLVELPMREKITISQKRAAQRSQGGSSSSSKTYMLVTTLPPAFRAPEILGAGTVDQKEEAYIGLVTTICSLVYLNGRSLSEAKLDRYLRRLNIEATTPLDKTDKLLNTMCRQGYLNRVKDNTGGETQWEYHLGPRAKLEIGKSGVVNLVEEVYGVKAPADLAERVGRNIGVEEEQEQTSQRTKGRSAGTQKARRDEVSVDDDDDDDDDDD